MLTKLEFTYPKINSRGKYWYVWYRAKHPITGKWKLFVHKKGVNRYKKMKDKIKYINSLKDALVYALMNNIYNPFHDESFEKRKTLPVALNDVLELKKASLRGRSIVHYKDVLTIFKGWLKIINMEYIYPDQFTKQNAILYADYLLKNRNYSGKTHNIHVGTLKTFFNIMQQREIVALNPFTGIPKLHESEGSNIPYTENEKTRIIDYLKVHNIRLYYAVCFVYYCFIRRTELIQLKVQDIDLKNYTILIHSSSSKTKQFRSVTIPTAFELILNEMNLDKYSPDCYIFGHRFQTCERKIVKPESLTYAMTRVNKKLEIKNKSFYTFKHSGMVALYNATHDPYICMKQAGHSELKMTQRYLRSLGLIVDETIRKADFTF